MIRKEKPKPDSQRSSFCPLSKRHRFLGTKTKSANDASDGRSSDSKPSASLLPPAREPSLEVEVDPAFALDREKSFRKLRKADPDLSLGPSQRCSFFNPAAAVGTKCVNIR